MGMTAVIKTHKEPGDYQNRCCLWAFDGVTWPIYRFTEQMSKEYQKNDFNNSMLSNCQKVAHFFAGFPLVLKHGNGQSPSSLMIFLLKTNIDPSGFAIAMLHVCFPGGIHEIPMILIIFQPSIFSSRSHYFWWWTDRMSPPSYVCWFITPIN